MFDLQSFIDQAWADHADDPRAVALRLPQALDAVRSEAQWLALGGLAQHVLGGHLAAWSDARDHLAALARSPAFDAQGASGRSMRQWRASLALAAGDNDLRSTLSRSESITATAQAAAALEMHDIGRATAYLQEALAAADATELPATDPALRALAVAGNNLAANLAEKTRRSTEERNLMLLAAQTGRRFWARAGTWLETERAEHRLAMCCLAAGDAERARHHAHECLAIVDAQVDAPALERFFGHDALARAEGVLGHGAAQARSVAALRDAFTQLGADDKAWCQATLDAHSS